MGKFLYFWSMLFLLSLLENRLISFCGHATLILICVCFTPTVSSPSPGGVVCIVAMTTDAYADQADKTKEKDKEDAKPVEIVFVEGEQSFLSTLKRKQMEAQKVDQENAERQKKPDEGMRKSPPPH